MDPRPERSRPRGSRAVLLLGFTAACVLASCVRADEEGCAVSYDEASPTCGDSDEKPTGPGATKVSGSNDASGKLTCVVEPGVDYPGDEVDGDVDFLTDVASSEACCELCKSTKHCQFWTFSTPERGRQPNYCWLKNKRVKPYRITGAHGLISGFVKKNKASEKQAKGSAPRAELESKEAGGKQKKGPSKKRVEKAKALVQEAQGLYHKGRARDAEPLLKKAVEKDETNGAARMWQGFVLEQLGRWQDAMYAYEAAIAPGRRAFLRENDAAMVHNNLGLLYRNKQNRHDDAEAQYRLAIAASEKAGMTTWTHAHKNLARLLEKNGRAREAMEHLDVVADRQGNDALRFYSALLLPYVYEDKADIDGWRKTFKRNLKALAKRGISIADPFNMEGVPQYYLSYHGRNDARINSEIAKLFRKSCASCVFRAPHTLDHKPKAADAKIRVGFMSYYFREHSVSKMTLGLAKGLDSDKFHTVLYQFGHKDWATEQLASYMTKLVMLENVGIESAQRLVADEELDVLIFAEIGMDPHSYAMAFGRHAPIQIAMHGHAQTTGIRSIDYYVSYAGFSEPQAQAHYSEKLLVVDGFTPLPRYYDLVPYKLSPHMHAERGRNTFKSRFRIPPEATVYACLQTLFKVDPRMDEVALGILHRHPGSVVLFKELPMTDQVGKQVIARMKKTFSEAEMQRVFFMPPLNDQDYRDAYLIVDVLIDSFPFGGHTTTMDAFSAGCPVVSMPTDLMSGRCTQGFLKFMGLGELIVDKIEELVDVAVKIGKDKAYRDRLSATIREKLPALIKDDTSVREWEDLLVAAGREGESGLSKWQSKSGQRKDTGG